MEQDLGRLSAEEARARETVILKRCLGHKLTPEEEDLRREIVAGWGKEPPR